MKKSRPRAREGAQRTDLLSSRNWTTKAHNNYTLWDRTSGRRQGGLFLDSQPICGTKPRWAFLGRHCGSRPNRGSAFLGHRQWDQTKVGFSWTALWDRTKPVAEEGGLFLSALVEPDQTRPDKTKADAGEGRWAFLGRPCGTRPRRTRPDQTRQTVN